MGEEICQLFPPLPLPFHLPPDGGVVVVPDSAHSDSDASLARRLRRFTGPQLLAIDEVGYLNYDNRYADLLFEVVTRRYLTVPVLITTNKPFSEWGDVFSSAACVVTLVDRLIHRSE